MRFTYAEAMTDPSYYLPLAKAAEAAGYTSMAVADSLAYPKESDSVYPYTEDGSREFLEDKAFIETFTLIAAMGAVTSTIRFTPFVLKLPVRPPVLVAKQATSVQYLTGGRLGLGVGLSPWPEDFEVMGVSWARRGKRMDEAIDLLRAAWGDERIDARGERFVADAIAMEPKPPQGRDLPIWIGGTAPAALRRAGERGDGWMGMLEGGPEQVRAMIDTVRRHAAAAGRDPDGIGLQAMLAPPPNDQRGKEFYRDHDRVLRRAEEVARLGFGWLSINATAIFQAGARSVDAIIEQLAALHGRLREVTG